MKICILLALICILFSSGLLAENWTILVYMAADNGLSEYAAQDIREMQSAVIPSNVTLIVQADFPSTSTYSGCRRYKIQHSTSSIISSPIIQEMGEVNSGDPCTLNDFMDWGFRKYPADRKMVVIWSHGDSWFKDASSKWICPDASSEALMSIANGDLNTAFNGIPKLDILLFDACSMQSVEVLYEVRQYADYVIGSEDLVPVNGFPYQDLIPLFSQAINDILLQLPTVFTQSYAALGSQNPEFYDISTTCSVIRTDILQQFSNEYAVMVLNNREIAPQLLQLRSNLYSMNTMYADIDIREFLTALTTANSSISIDAVALLELWDQIVVQSSALGYSHNIGTAAIWFPEYRIHFDNWWSHYYKLDFANKSWLSLLNVAWGDDVSPPATPVILSQDRLFNTLYLKVAIVPDPDRLIHRFYYVYDHTSELAVASIRQYHDYIQVKIPIQRSCSVVYRLIDLSGNESDSISFDVLYELPHDAIVAAPNPSRANQNSYLKYYMQECESSEGNLSIFNLRGQKLYSCKVPMSSGSEGTLAFGYKTDIVLSAGVYVAVLTNGKRKLVSKLCIIP